MPTAENRIDGAAIIDLHANRWTDFDEDVIFNNDLTGATFEAQVRLLPDSPGTALETFAISAPVIGGGTTEFTLSLSEAEMAALPGATEIGDDLTLYWDLKMTIGGAARILFVGKFIVLSGVTQ
jgi:hypothetical protein